MPKHRGEDSTRRTTFLCNPNQRGYVKKHENSYKKCVE